MHFLLCRKIPFCSTDILFSVCWGSAQPYVIYWAWLHCQCCFPSIINNYNAETSLIFIVHSLHFSLKWISAEILVSADATLCSAGLTNFFGCNCGTLNQEGACEDVVSGTLLSHHRPQCHFCQRRRWKTLPWRNKRQRAKETQKMRWNYNKVATQGFGTWRWWNRSPL